MLGLQCILSKRNRRRITIFFLTVTILIGSMQGLCMPVKAASTKSLTMVQAQKLAIASDKEYQRTYNKIEIKKVKYITAIKSIQMKKKNMRTFRWTPLLSFKFPEQPALVDEYEWQYKPVQLQSEITALQHKLTDVQYACAEEVARLYVQAYVCQEKIAFLEQRVVALEDKLTRNRARVITGEGTQADVDVVSKAWNKAQNELALQLRTYQKKKEKLKDKTKLDVTMGYEFVNPILDAEIPRSVLPEIINHTLENDQNYYEIKLKESISYTSLGMTESLMYQHYGRKMNDITPYVQQARNGEDINEIDFKKSYDSFLQKIDAKWKPYLRFFFIKISLEWFKGAVDGSRYVEDDPYALYSAALEYQDAKAEKEAAKKQLEVTVEESYENLITARNAYQTMVVYNEELKKDMLRSQEWNKRGELTLEELQDKQDTYEQSQMEELELVDTYNQLLYSFNRLTCGAITKYIKGLQIGMDAMLGGDSYVTADEIKGAYYYLETRIEDRIFMLGVVIPEDFEPVITHYELRVNEVLIGERMPVEKQLRHLSLDFESVQTTYLYLYQDENLIETCAIDPDINRAALEIKGNYRVEDNEENQRKVASYTYQMDAQKKLITLQIMPEPGEEIAYYRLTDRNGNVIYQETLVEIKQPYQYLAVLGSDLSEIKVECYDAQKQLLYIGSTDTRNGSIWIEE